MKTKDVLLVGAGVALGYLIFKKDLFKKKTTAVGQIATGASDVVTGTGEVISGAVGAVSTGVNTLLDGTGGIRPSKEAYAKCEQKWEEFASMAKFAGPEGTEKARVEFMNSCLLG
jgi:hypothetical protein